MLALVTDQFKVTRDLNRIARTEDLQFGWNGTLQLGWSSPSLGADRDAGIVNGQLTYGVRLPHGVDNFTSLTYNTRLEHGLTDDEHAGGQETLYWRTSERTLFYFRASGDSGRNVDLDHYDLLGGDSGLRGYPLRYQMGTSRALMTVEERGYTPWSLLHLLDIGGAAFFDVGRTWGPNLVQEPPLGWLSDAGIGLRLGNNRSSLGNVIHIDLATPLNSGNPNLHGLQLLVSTQATY
jgi:outer membrane protein assembly factor BamA